MDGQMVPPATPVHHTEEYATARKTQSSPLAAFDRRCVWHSLGIVLCCSLFAHSLLTRSLTLTAVDPPTGRVMPEAISAIPQMELIYQSTGEYSATRSLNQSCHGATPAPNQATLPRFNHLEWTHVRSPHYSPHSRAQWPLAQPFPISDSRFPISRFPDSRFPDSRSCFRIPVKTLRSHSRPSCSTLSPPTWLVY